LLDLCCKNSNTVNNVYDGYIIDVEENKNNTLDLLELYEYKVYLPELKIVSKIKLREKVARYTKHKICLYIFQDEEKFKKKVRLQILGEVPP